MHDLVLHGWLVLTGGAWHGLRVPSVAFFAAGLFVLSRAAFRMGGARAAMATTWLGALSPFGFHYGRLAAWYSFSFLVLAAVTWAYPRAMDRRTASSWCLLFVSCVALVWTNYFGWVILACLLVEQAWRSRSGEPRGRLWLLLGTLALSFLAFAPLLRAFVNQLADRVHVQHAPLTMLATTAFHVYALFVSEAVAPWHWGLSVPAALAILATVGLTIGCAPDHARRLLLYTGLMIALMSVTGILNSKRLLALAPWLLVPIGVAIGTVGSRRVFAALALSLAVIGGVGWYGIVARTYYAAPRFIEPWDRVVETTAARVAEGATVVGNHPSFFFYLTYALKVPPETPWRFAGVLPDEVEDPRVRSAEGWMNSDRPLMGKVVWVRGASPERPRLMEHVVTELERRCRRDRSESLLRDDGFQWKQRFFPDRPEWRIDVREFDCG